MAYYECLPTRLNPLAERTYFSQVAAHQHLRARRPPRRLPRRRPPVLRLARRQRRDLRRAHGDPAGPPLTKEPFFRNENCTWLAQIVRLGAFLLRAALLHREHRQRFPTMAINRLSVVVSRFRVVLVSSIQR
jgi:hypothetical protein